MWKSSRAVSVGVALGLFVLVSPETNAKAEESGGAPAALSAVSNETPAGALAPSEELSVPSGGSNTADEDSRIAEIDALLQGHLASGVEPQSLFNVQLSDPARVDAEIVRLQALDQARLKFLALPEEERERLLKLHRERTLAKIAVESADERETRLAEEERRRALEAAQTAQAEVHRILEAELTELVATETQLDRFKAALVAERQAEKDRETELLGWRRRALEVKARPAAEVDTFYDSLRRALKLTRQELSDTLAQLRERRSGVPSLKADALAPLSNDPTARPIVIRRRNLLRSLGEARAEEFAWLEVRADKAMTAIESLNAERLGLLHYLSPQKRHNITGFTAGGFHQASAEIWQLTLVVRHHAYVSQRWLTRLAAADRSIVNPLAILSAVVRLGLLLWVFSWIRRNSPEFLRVTEKSLFEAERHKGTPKPWSRLQLVRLLRHIQRPLTTLLFVLAFGAVLKESTARVLEVQLLMAILVYAALGSVAVNLVHALVLTKAGPRFVHQEELSSGLLLSSLKFVGRTIVIVLLVLNLSSHLVGEGTIYSWVLSTTWLLALVVSLLLVRWWRETIFDRLAEMRQKPAFIVWLLENRTGWKSFLAASLGATAIVGAAVSKMGKKWLSRFTLVRRGHAYLFRRELAKRGDERQQGTLSALAPEGYEALSPSAAANYWLPCPADALIECIEARVRSASPGLIGIVAPKGAGKTAFLAELGRKFGYPVISLSQSSVDSAPELLKVNADEKAVLVDDAHVWLRPTIGGFQAFDALISLARAKHPDKIWVFAIDAALWPILRRARDSEPPFNQVFVLSPWEEEQIAKLLITRTQDASLEPNFERLVERMPAGADESDWAEEIALKREGYVRMLWDQTRGNPGLSLEIWRSSLKQDDAGGVHVSPIKIPDGIQLDTLPDTTLFLLRSVLQFGPVRPRDVAKVVRLDEARVFEILKLNSTQGILVLNDEFFSVSWSWLNPLRAALKRRHLWVDS